MYRLIITFFVAVLIPLNVIAANKDLLGQFKYQSKLANAGSPEAMMKLAKMYEKGKGTKKDLKKALLIYQQALEMYKRELVESYKEATKVASPTMIKKNPKRSSRNKITHNKTNRTKVTKSKKRNNTRIKSQITSVKSTNNKNGNKHAKLEPQSSKDKRKQHAITINTKQKKIIIKQEKENGFSSDPCKTAAAKLMSKCRKR